MTLSFVLQLFLPLAAILWLAFGRPSTSMDLLLRAIAAVLLLAAAAVAGLWLLVPRMILLLIGLLMLLALWKAVRALPQSSEEEQAQRVGPGGWLGRVGGFLAVGLGALIVVQGVRGRTPPSMPIDISLPFDDGRYLVTAGGSTAVINPHLATSASGAAPLPGQAQAIDLVSIDEFGFRTHGRTPFTQPDDPAAYRIFGRPVVAPCTGLVVAVEDNMPDRRVSTDAADADLGNHLILRCGLRVIALGGLKQGSITVDLGARVRKNARIAAVGNSGEAGEPHLHMQVQLAPAEEQPLLSGAAVPFRLLGTYPIRSTQFDVRYAAAN